MKRKPLGYAAVVLAAVGTLIGATLAMPAYAASSGWFRVWLAEEVGAVIHSCPCESDNWWFARNLNNPTPPDGWLFCANRGPF